MQTTERAQSENLITAQTALTEPAARVWRWSPIWLVVPTWLTARRVLAIALVLGAFVRLWDINSVGYNSDEAVYAGQAASLAHDPELSKFFPIFRAHPMLVQYLLALVFQFGVSDVGGRLFVVACGLATLYVVYQLGRLVYDPWTGAVAALLLAVMPYHVLVTRQLLLDGPMTLLTTFALYLLARFAATQRPALLYATGATLGLSILTKETSVVVVGAVYAFLALSPRVRVRIRDLVIGMACLFGTIIAYPLSVTLAGRTDTAKSYLIWQLFRRSNHVWSFYPTVVPPAIGIGVILLAIAGLWLLRRERTWRETLLISWIIVPAAFFQLWPVKGFQYWLPIAAPIAVLAARTICRWQPSPGASGATLSQCWARVRKESSPSRSIGSDSSLRWREAWEGGKGWGVRAGIVILLVLSLLIPTWQRIQPATDGQLLAGTGGMPGGREAGAWIAQNVPDNAVFVTIGPSMANIVQFYGHHKAYGLSVSPNPLHRNPSYTPVINPDYQIHYGEVQYLVYDVFSASRSSFFANSLLTYVKKYSAREVHAEYMPVTSDSGSTVMKKIIIIYEARP